MDNLTKQVDEMEVLNSIYGDDWKSDGGNSYRFTIRESGREVNLMFNLPDNYPSECPPSFEMSAPALTKAEKNSVTNALNDVYLENLGETVIYQWIEKIREYLQSLPDLQLTSSIKEPIALVQEKNVHIDCPEITHGNVLEDRKSHFQGHVARLQTPSDVKAVLYNLKLERKIASATHNILAWKCGLHQDCDDDGEKAAGSRLLKLIDLLNLDNTIVVVSRWYGGIHLGSDRFRHINNAARQALVKAGFIPR